jgi:hypothetical protein
VFLRDELAADYGVDRLYAFRANRKLRILLGKAGQRWVLLDFVTRNDKAIYSRER